MRERSGPISLIMRHVCATLRHVSQIRLAADVAGFALTTPTPAPQLGDSSFWPTPRMPRRAATAIRGVASSAAKHVGAPNLPAAVNGGLTRASGDESEKAVAPPLPGAAAGGPPGRSLPPLPSSLLLPVSPPQVRQQRPQLLLLPTRKAPPLLSPGPAEPGAPLSDVSPLSTPRSPSRVARHPLPPIHAGGGRHGAAEELSGHSVAAPQPPLRRAATTMTPRPPLPAALPRPRHPCRGKGRGWPYGNRTAFITHFRVARTQYQGSRSISSQITGS